MAITPAAQYGRGSTGPSSRSGRAFGRSNRHHVGAVRIFFTIIQGRTFGAPGLTALSREQRGRARAVEKDKRPGSPAVDGRCSTGGLAVAGRRLPPRPSDDSPADAAAAAHGTPGDRPPAVPPYPLPRPPAPRPGGQSHARCVGGLEDVTGDGPETMLPRIVRVGPPASRAPEDRF
jgi:hypothetical protein